MASDDLKPEDLKPEDLQPEDLEFLKDLLDRASEMPEQERRSYLISRCGERADLLAEALELISFDQTLSSDLVCPDHALIHDLTGTSLGPYRLEKLLGEGGMGSVYLAQQQHNLKRQVAVKVIKLGMDTKEVIARFESERQVLALMDHPSIARVLDAGATDQGRPYFVMEYIEGVPITTYCQHRQCSLSQRIDLFLQVCRGVHHAHQRGIIHRDIKPSNILITDQDGQPTAKIIDFGVAKAVEQSARQMTALTVLGRMVGTLEYMSPEQAQSDVTSVDTRSDIYSLGAVFYELLTGHVPYGKSELFQAGLEGIQHHLDIAELELPSTRVESNTRLDVAQHDTQPQPTPRWHRNLKGDLDWITVKALAKDPEDRYDTVATLADDLQRHLRDQPVLAGPPSIRYRLGKYFRRHRTAVTIGLLLTASLILGTFGTTIGMIRANRAEKSALAAVRRAESVYLFELAKSESIPTRQLALVTKALELSDRPQFRRLAHHLMLEGPAYTQLPIAPDSHNPWDLEFSPDGRWLAVSWSKNSTIQLFNLETGHLVEMRGQGGATARITFSADSRLLATTHHSNLLHLWSVDKQELIRTWDLSGWSQPYFTADGQGLLVGVVQVGHPMTWMILDIEGSGRKLVGEAGPVVTNDDTAPEPGLDPTLRWLAQPVGNRLLLFDLQDLASGPLRELGQHSEIISGAEFSPDGKTVLSFDAHGLARLWKMDLSAQEPLREFVCSSNTISATFSPDGSQLAISGLKEMTIWDLAHSSSLVPVSLRTSPWMFHCAFSPDGKWMATTSTGRMVALWPNKKGFYPLTLSWPGEDTIHQGFSPDGRLMITTSHSGEIWKWPLHGRTVGDPELIYANKDFGFQSPRFDDASRYVFFSTCNSSQGSGTLVKIDLANGNVMTWPGGTCEAVTSPDGRFLAINSDEAMGVFQISVLDTETDQRTKLSGPGSRIAAGFSAENALLAYGEGILGLWEPGYDNFHPLRQDVSWAKLAPDRRTYIFSQGDGGFFKGEIGSAHVDTFSLNFHYANRYTVAMDSSASFLISGCPQGEVEVLDHGSKRRFQIPLHDQTSWIVSVDPKGRWLASLTDNELRLVSPPSGLPVWEMTHESFLQQLHAQTNVRVRSSETSETGYEFFQSEGFSWSRSLHSDVKPGLE